MKCIISYRKKNYNERKQIVKNFRRTYGKDFETGKQLTKRELNFKRKKFWPEKFFFITR